MLSNTALTSTERGNQRATIAVRFRRRVDSAAMRGNRSSRLRAAPIRTKLMLLLGLVGIPARSAADRPESFEGLEAKVSSGSLQTLEQVWEHAESLLPRCTKQNEFAARECAAKAKRASLLLSRGMIMLPVSHEQVTLGRYDFGQKHFPASLRSQLGSKQVPIDDSGNHQTGETDDDAECPEVEQYETDHEDELTLVSTGTVAWQGTLRVADLALARQIRENETSVEGDVILAFEGVSERRVEDQTSLLRKQTALRKLASYVTGQYPSAVKQQARKKLRCWNRVRSSWRQIVVKARLVALRLHVDDDRVPGYLVSVPPSLPRARKSLAQAPTVPSQPEVQSKPTAPTPAPPPGYEDIF